jgi:hypothetical protein
MAIDNLGREIILPAAASLDPGAIAMGSSIWVTIAYQERFDPGDAQTLGTDTKYIRSTEAAQLAWTDSEPPYDGAVIVLAKVSAQGGTSGTVYSISTPPRRGTAGRGVQPAGALTVRNIRVTGIVDLPGPDEGTPLHAPLRVSGRLVIDPNEALGGADGSGALSIYSADRDIGFHLQVGTHNGSRQLGINAGSGPGDNADVLTISATGNIGIHAPHPDFLPDGRRALTVNSAICAGTSELYFTDAAHPVNGFGNKPGYASIQNSSDSIYNALMILGRNIGTESAVRRVVKIWDELVVNGQTSIGTTAGRADLTVFGDIYCTGTVKKLVVSTGGGL